MWTSVSNVPRCVGDMIAMVCCRCGRVSATSQGVWVIWLWWCVVDVDECQQRPKVCEFTCSNTLGSFVCGCPAGYVLNMDQRTCRGQLVPSVTGGSDTYIYIYIYNDNKNNNKTVGIKAVKTDRTICIIIHIAWFLLFVIRTVFRGGCVSTEF